MPNRHHLSVTQLSSHRQNYYFQQRKENDKKATFPDYLKININNGFTTMHFSYLKNSLFYVTFFLIV